jgi:putative transposase
MTPPNATPVTGMEQADDGRTRLDDSPPLTSVIRALRLKVKSESYPWLNSAAMEVNTVWNGSAEVTEKAARPCTGKAKWLTGFDLCALSSGASEYFQKIGADTIQKLCCEYALKRSSARRIRLRWRKSRGPRRSLGWIPL